MQREVWIDRLKGFAIICVVLGHFNLGESISDSVSVLVYASLPIYLIHSYFTFFADKMFHKFQDKLIVNEVISYIFISIFVLLCLYIISELMMKFLPRLLKPIK